MSNKRKNDEKQPNTVWLALGLALGVTINWWVGIAFLVVYMAKEFEDRQQKSQPKQEPIKIKRDDY